MATWVTTQQPAARHVVPSAWPSWIYVSAVASLTLAAVVGVAVDVRWGLLTLLIGLTPVVVRTDVEWRRIPDVISVALTAWAPLAWLVHGVSLTWALIGAAVVGLPVLTVHLVHPGAVGFGDVKLVCALGLALGTGWAAGGAATLVVSLFLVVGSRPIWPDGWRRSCPFGVFLMVASLAVTVVSVLAVGGP